MKKFFRKIWDFILWILGFLIPLSILILVVYLFILWDKWADKTINDVNEKRYSFSEKVKDFCKWKMNGKLYLDSTMNSLQQEMIPEFAALNQKLSGEIFDDYSSFYYNCVGFYSRDTFESTMTDSIKWNFCRWFGYHFYENGMYGDEERYCLDNRDYQFRGSYERFPF